MNYSLTDLPDAGNNPVVYMDITLKGEDIGRIYIRLFRDAFPAGVENFVRIAAGRTYQVTKPTNSMLKYKKEVRRTYDGSKFFRFLHNNYIVAGDIYMNNGKSAGTIYSDQKIPPGFGEYFYPHETKGLVSLVPFVEEATGKLFYDSTFMITLADAKPSNILSELDTDQVVIGQVTSGIDVLDKMNLLIKPFAGRIYPDFYIKRSDVHRINTGSQSKPKLRSGRKFITEPTAAVQ